MAMVKVEALKLRMPFHNNSRQLHLPQVIHRQQFHGYGSLSVMSVHATDGFLVTFTFTSLGQDGGRNVTEDHVAGHPETQFLGPIGLTCNSKTWISFCHPGIISQEISW